MAVVTALDTDVIIQVMRDTVNKAGSLYIDRGYYTDEDQHIEAISDLTNPTQLSSNTLKIGDLKISSVFQHSLDEAITYKVVYLCNSSDDILARVDVEEATSDEINDTFILDFTETNEVR